MLSKSLCVTFWCVMVAVALAEESPVFLWGASTPQKPALLTVSENEFTSIAAPLLENHMIVAFQEEDLSPTDFRCTKNKKTCLPFLQGVSDNTYYANVENPTEALRASTVNREFNSVGKSGELANELECEVGKLVFVNFDSKEEQRDLTLQEHDSAINKISEKLSCPVVYILMSTPSPAGTVQKRVRRDVSDTAASEGGYLFRDGANFLLFFTKLSFKDQSKTTDLTISTMTTKSYNTSAFGVTLTASDSSTVTFDIVLVSGYYYMRQLIYNKILYRTTDVNSPPEFSYFCGNLTVNANDGSGSQLLWNSVQFQAPFGNTKDVNFVFGDSWNCVGFFTPGILGGLFVATLLLAIAFTGICWMMDINTMDRFDDPKGKTITINATD